MLNTGIKPENVCSIIQRLNQGFLNRGPGNTKKSVDNFYGVREDKLEICYAEAVKKLDNHFATTYLYESKFSSLVAIKSEVKASCM